MTGKDRPHGLPLPLPGLMAALFAASWAGLLFLVLRTIGKIWPAMTIFDAPSLIAGALLIPMAFFLIQSLFHLPSGLGRAFLVRVRPAAPCFMILFPVARRTERGPALSIVASPGDAELIVRELENLTAHAFGLVPRLALLFSNRSPLEVLLKRLMTSAFKPLSLLGWLFFLLVSPARQFTRLWGYVFTRLWSDPEPGPDNELFKYKRDVAYDLYREAKKFGVENMEGGEAVKLLAQVWHELKRIHQNPLYGQDLGEALPEAPEEGEGAFGPVAAYYKAPRLDPRYRGAYLNLSVTLAARGFHELYDFRLKEDTALFYPPELGHEVEKVGLIMAEKERLLRRLGELGEEGVAAVDGRPVPTWTIDSWLFDLEGRLDYYKRRIAAHHRRCRTAHLLRARGLAKGWPEYLEAIASILHFAEHAGRALTTARGEFEAALPHSKNIAGEAARFHALMADLHDRLLHLDLTEPLEVRPEDMLPLSLPSPAADLGAWLTGWESELKAMLDLLSALREKVLAALLWGEDKVAGRLTRAGDELEEAPPAPSLATNFISLRPPLAPPERVYSMAERLNAGFGHCLLAALVMALLLWQSQTLGRTRLVIYNGFGRDVTVWVGEEEALLPPYGRAALNLHPGQLYEVWATSGELPFERFAHESVDESAPETALVRSHLIEHFNRRLAPTPATEVYNIAGAAPLMQWWSRPEAGGAESGEEFLGRPLWLSTAADILFRAPTAKETEPALVLSGYGELPPSEMLPAFPLERDQGELIYLHALWDNPGASSFWQWQSMALGRVQADILIQRLAREPDFLEKCAEQLGRMGIE